jgi:hypothetical protein
MSQCKKCRKFGAGSTSTEDMDLDGKQVGQTRRQFKIRRKVASTKIRATIVNINDYLKGFKASFPNSNIDIGKENTMVWRRALNKLGTDGLNSLGRSVCEGAPLRFLKAERSKGARTYKRSLRKQAALYGQGGVYFPRYGSPEGEGRTPGSAPGAGLSLQRP